MAGRGWVRAPRGAERRQMRLFVPNSHSAIARSIVNRERKNTHTHTNTRSRGIRQDLATGTLHHMTPRDHDFRAPRLFPDARCQTQVCSFHMRRAAGAARQEVSCESGEMRMFGLASLLIRPQAFRDTPAVSCITRLFS